MYRGNPTSMSQTASNVSHFKKARKHAYPMLSKEPMSLVEKYLGSNQAESKASVFDRLCSRFSKPAYPVENGCPSASALAMCNC